MVRRAAGGWHHPEGPQNLPSSSWVFAFIHSSYAPFYGSHVHQVAAAGLTPFLFPSQGPAAWQASKDRLAGAAGAFLQSERLGCSVLLCVTWS